MDSAPGTAEEWQAKCKELEEKLEVKTDELKRRVDASREERLNAAFDFFDLDGSGELNEDEFFKMGQAMHKGKGTWTRAQNAKAMKAVPHEREGLITRAEYVTFYKKTLARANDKQFNDGIGKLLISARTVAGDTIGDLKNAKLEAGKNQFKMFMMRMTANETKSCVANWSNNYLEGHITGNALKYSELKLKAQADVMNAKFEAQLAELASKHQAELTEQRVRCQALIREKDQEIAELNGTMKAAAAEAAAALKKAEEDAAREKREAEEAEAAAAAARAAADAAEGPEKERLAKEAAELEAKAEQEKKEAEEAAAEAERVLGEQAEADPFAAMMEDDGEDEVTGELRLQVKVNGNDIDHTELAMAVGIFCGGAGMPNGAPSKSMLSKNQAWYPVKVSPSLLSPKSKMRGSKVDAIKGQVVAGFTVADARPGEAVSPLSPRSQLIAEVSALDSAQVEKVVLNVSGMADDDLVTGMLTLKVKVACDSPVDPVELAMAVGRACGGSGMPNGEPMGGLLNKKDLWYPIKVAPSLLSPKSKMRCSTIDSLKGQVLDDKFKIKQSSKDTPKAEEEIDLSAMDPVPSASDSSARDPPTVGEDGMLHLHVLVPGEVDADQLAIAVGAFCGGTGCAQGEPRKSKLSKPDTWYLIVVAKSLLSPRSQFDGVKAAQMKDQTLGGFHIKDATSDKYDFY